MLSYIVRRLLIMVPTLFGVTIVSFFIMKLAPGDPLLTQAGGGTSNQSSAHEDFRVRKREFFLDKPLFFNLRFFEDFSEPLRSDAYFLAASPQEIVAQLKAMQEHPERPEVAERLKFLRSLGITEFDKLLADSQRWPELAARIWASIQVYSEDLGVNGVPAAIALLNDPNSDQHTRIGAIKALRAMIDEPFKFTYSTPPREDETPAVIAAWKSWWERAQKTTPPVDAEAKKYLQDQLTIMTGGREQVMAGVERIADSDNADAAPRFFAETLLGESSFAEKVAASTYLKQAFPAPLKLDVSLNASKADVDAAAANWQQYYRLHQDECFPSVPAKLWNIVSDTQYAHMVARLATFNFGHSYLKTREPVSEKIWSGFVISAPLMLLSELVIYFFAVPLGLVCGVYRGGWTDRLVSLGLFLLYSIPPFVAAMLFLEYLCYGNPFKLFPMMRLHSDNAEHLAWLPYLRDYLWHAFLPVVCLSLFSLAAIAMYSRSALLDVINQDYIRTARAKGLSGPMVIMKHALRNSLIPILTLFSTFLPTMLGGSVLIENLFDIPGLGNLGWSSVLQRDYPTLMALLYVEAIVTLVSFLLTDLLYVLVDPRISFGGRGKAA
jgi:peptide/nickel transport system permease protein